MNDEKNYWFKRRRYGYGWTPVTKQGWIATGVSIAVIALAAVFILPMDTEKPNSLRLVTFFLVMLSVVFTLIGISLAKGPMPKWRWGVSPTDDPSEDL